MSFVITLTDSNLVWLIKGKINNDVIVLHRKGEGFSVDRLSVDGDSKYARTYDSIFVAITKWVELVKEAEAE